MIGSEGQSLFVSFEIPSPLPFICWVVFCFVTPFWNLWCPCWLNYWLYLVQGLVSFRQGTLYWTWLN